MPEHDSLLIPKEQLKDAKPWSPGAFPGGAPSGERRAANQGQYVGPGRRENDPPPRPLTPEERAAAAEAARIAAEQARAAKAMQAARRKAFDAGYAEGKQLVEAHLARLAKLGAETQAAFAHLEAEVAEQLLVLAFDIARQVIRTEITLNRESMLPMVQEVLRSVPEGTSGGELLLNPDDVELVRSQLDEALRLGGWRVMPEKSIEPGGCRLVSRVCDIDSTLPARWRRAMHSLARDDAWEKQ